MRSLVPKSVKKIAHLGSKSENFAHLSQDRKNSSHISNQPKSSILHPAGRFQLHFNSVRSNMVQPCTRFAGIPRPLRIRPFRRALKPLHFISISLYYIGSAALLLLCEAAAQSAAAAGRAGNARWRGAARGKRPSWPGEQRHFPL